MDQTTSIIVTAFIAFSILSGFVVLRMAFARQRKGREDAATLAGFLGLELLDPEASLRRSHELAGDQAIIAGIEKLPAPILSFLTKNSNWVMEGKRGGFRVAVFQDTRSSGDSQTNYTVVRAFLPVPLPCALRVTREGAMTKLGKALLHLQDIEIGDPDIDPAIRVKSLDPEAARRALGSPEARRAILAALAEAPGFVLEQGQVSWEKQGNVTDQAIITPILDALVKLAKGFSAAH